MLGDALPPARAGHQAVPCQLAPHRQAGAALDPSAAADRCERLPSLQRGLLGGLAQRGRDRREVQRDEAPVRNAVAPDDTRRLLGPSRPSEDVELELVVDVLVPRFLRQLQQQTRDLVVLNILQVEVGVDLDDSATPVSEKNNETQNGIRTHSSGKVARSV